MHAHIALLLALHSTHSTIMGQIKIVLECATLKQYLCYSIGIALCK